VQEPQKLFQLIEQLEMPELCIEERLGIASQLREALGMIQGHAPSKEDMRLARCLAIST